MLNGVTLEAVNVYKYLGFHLDDRLTYAHHVAYVKSRILPYIAMLKRLRSLIPESLSLSAYYAYVHSHLSHMVAVWGFSYEYLMEQVQVLQNRAIRFVFWKDYNQNGLPTEEIYQKYSILKVRQLLKYDAIMNIYKMSPGLLRLNKDLMTFDQIHGYGTRYRTDFVLPLTRTSAAQRSLFSRGLAWFNSLPPQLKLQPSFLSFKRSLKTFIMNERIATR